ncbi:hypothetical protein Ancab_032330 [Ancistrocladus abbreviatus]
MDTTLKMSSSITQMIPTYHELKISGFGHRSAQPITKIIKASVSCNISSGAGSNSVGNRHRRSSLESLFSYDKAIPEEIIEKPVGLSIAEKAIGEKPRCTHCQAKGAVLCATCSGSGLYIDSILESQGIMVKVRCLDVSWNGETESYSN